MSLYWYACCDKCKTMIDIGESHTSGFNPDEAGLELMLKHSGHPIRLIADPDYDIYPELLNYETEKP